MQITAQTAAPLDVDRLVDGRVGHPHLRIIGKVQPQPSSDLFGTVLLVESSLHLTVQLLIDRQLAPLRPPRPLLGARLRPRGAITRLGIPAALLRRPEPIPLPIPPIAERISRDLTHDRRRRAPQLICDLADGLAHPNTYIDHHTLTQGQPRPLTRPLVRKFRSHPASISKPLAP